MKICNIHAKLLEKQIVCTLCLVLRKDSNWKMFWLIFFLCAHFSYLQIIISDIFLPSNYLSLNT